jgi:ssDNA-binding Zn-finger/Zn-ribbon topoisomerase 1
MSSFQVCPKCNGTGKRINPVPETSWLAVVANIGITMPYFYKDENGELKVKPVENICPVCNGKMIISTETGKPPID